MTSEYQNLHYVGSFTTLQTQGNSKYMKQGAISFTPEQKRLYSQLLIGKKLYTKTELYAMNSKTKNKMRDRHIDAQKSINLFKQEKLIATTNKIMQVLFPPKSAIIFEQSDDGTTKVQGRECNKLTSLFLDNSETDDKLTNSMTFKDLGITKLDIVERFISEKLLPEQFWAL